MGSKPNPSPVGTGQQGAPTPNTDEVEGDISTKTPDRIDRIADEMAAKGKARQQHDNTTEFTK